RGRHGVRPGHVRGDPLRRHGPGAAGRPDRRTGRDPGSAAAPRGGATRRERGVMNRLWWLARTVWRLLVIAVRYEMRIWRSLGVWVLRRRTVPAGGRGYAYAGTVTPLIIVFIAVSAVELPILHLVLP